MNAPLQAIYQTGQSLYAILINPVDGTVWNEMNTAWEAYNSGHWSQYAISLTEYSGSGYYRAAYPITVPVVLSTDLIYVQSGGSPTLGDVPASNLGQSQGVNVAAIGQSVNGANNLSTTTNLMLAGSVIAGTLTPSSFPTNLTSSVNAAYQGRTCFFATGELINQVGNIIAYDGTSFTITVGGPYTAAPSIGDIFIIV